MRNFDIIPPKHSFIQKPKFLKTPAKETVSRNRHFMRALWATGSVIIVLLGFFAFFILPEARVVIVLREEAVARDFEIRVDKNLSQPDSLNLAVPGQLVEQEVFGTKKVNSTGAKNVGRTASGFATIYNFSKTFLILKKDTTVLEANGRQYFFTQDVANIRPTAFIGLENQEVDPSSLIPPVPVLAAAPGQEYNLSENTRLEITNDAFGHQPKVLYAVVGEGLTGGTSKEIKIATESDIQNGHKLLTRELIDEGKKQLAAGKPSLRLLENAVSAGVAEFSSTVPPSTEIPEFEVSQKLKVKGLLYDEQDLKELISSRLTRLLPENKSLRQDDDARLAAQFAAVDLEQGFGVLVVHYEGQIVYVADPAELLERIKGRRVEEIREILLSRPEIEEVEIKFYPFWVKKAPKFSRKIYLKIENL